MSVLALTFNWICWLIISMLFVKQKRLSSTFSPLFWYLLFHFFVFLLRPSLDLMRPMDLAYNYMGINRTEELLATVHLVSMAGLIAFFAGHQFAIPATSTTKNLVLPLLGRGGQAFSWRGAIFATICVGPVALYSALFTGLDRLGGADLIEMERIDGIAVNVNQVGYLLDAQFMFIGILCLLALKARFALWAMLLIFAFLSYRILIGWGRWSIVLSVLALVLLHTASRGQRWPSKKWLLLAMPVAIFFFLLGRDRSFFATIFLQGVLDVSRISGLGLIDSLDSPDFANFEYLAYVIRAVPELSGTYSFGTQHLQLLTEPVPRVLWPEKPIGSPVQLVNLQQYGNFVGLTVSLVGDGWMTGGLVGVLFTCSLAGFLLGKSYSWFLLAPRSTWRQLLYVPIVALLLQFYRDGSLVTVVKFSAIVLIPVFLAALGERVRLLRRAHSFEKVLQ